MSEPDSTPQLPTSPEVADRSVVPRTRRGLRRFDPAHRLPAPLATPPAPTPLEVEQFSGLVGRAETQLADVVRLVEASPALSAVVLEAANSAELGLLQPVSRIPHAVALLGLRRLQALAFSLADQVSAAPRH